MPDDDVEEREVDGAMSFASSDLELVNDGARGDQTVGIRFNDLAVPAGARIKRAYVQFTTDEISTNSSHLFIEAEATDNASPFSSVT